MGEVIEVTQFQKDDSKPHDSTISTESFGRIVSNWKRQRGTACTRSN